MELNILNFLFLKLEKLLKLGFLARDPNTKRYFVNQSTYSRTKNLITKENIDMTIHVYSQYLSIVLNAVLRNQK